MPAVANARMYSVTPSVKADWNALLRAVLHRAGLDWEVIDFDAPAPLAALWARDDLGLVMMCGLPFSGRDPQPVLVAAPVPSPARYGGEPVYFTDIVVRSDSPATTLEDTFGGLVGYTLADSFSGGVALRAHLRQLLALRPGRLYRGAVGDLIHARGVIMALAQGQIDVGPLDSYCHDLLRLHEPFLADQVRTVATTQPRPIPPLVATARLSPDELIRLRSALLEAAALPDVAPRMERLLLSGFAVPDPRDYQPLSAIAADHSFALEEI